MRLDARVTRRLNGVRRRVESWATRAVVLFWYGVTLAVCAFRRRSRRSAWTSSGRIVVTGTFHNPGWFVSHLTPLARCGLREVIVVSHGDLPALAGVRCYPPPRWLTAWTGRTLSKLIWTIRAGARFSPDVFMGYHIIPNSTIALIAGRLFGRPACYQMTSGPIEVIGGGYRSSENPVLRRLGRPSRLLGRLAALVVGEFDLVVVRGRQAERFVADEARPDRIGIIPGSVDLSRFSGAPRARTYDLIFVGQLVTRKQPLMFVDVVEALRRSRPGVRAAIVGNGPMKDEVLARIAARRLEDAIDFLGQRADVGSLLARSRVFMLPSRNEGLSIAMAEAMISGVVPVVLDVGDLKDLVVDGETGYLVNAEDTGLFATRIEALLADSERWQRLSAKASHAARRHNGLGRVSELWAEHLRSLGAAVTQTTVPQSRARVPAIEMGQVDLT